jgi:P27 family predicted phage terminase small subunit
VRGTKPTLVVSNEAVSKVPPPPTWISKAAKDEWRRVMPVLVERRILTDADIGQLENYCIAQGCVKKAAQALQKTDDPDMILRLFRMQDKAMQTARQLASELGLTPVSRSRPAMREDRDDDDDNPLDLS